MCPKPIFSKLTFPKESRIRTSIKFRKENLSQVRGTTRRLRLLAHRRGVTNLPAGRQGNWPNSLFPSGEPIPAHLLCCSSLMCLLAHIASRALNLGRNWLTKLMLVRILFSKFLERIKLPKSYYDASQYLDIWRQSKLGGSW